MKTRVLLSFMAAAALTSTSYGALDHFLVAVDNTSGDGDTNEPSFSSTDHYTFDLMVDVTGGDDWTSTAWNASLLGLNPDAKFFQSTTFPGNGPPSAGAIGFSPATEYDSYYVGYDSGGNPTAPGFAAGPSDTDTRLDATWFDTNNVGDGTYQLARLTIYSPRFILSLSGASVGVSVGGTSTAESTGGQLLPFDLSIFAEPVPGPGALALLGLAGLASRRRRD